MDAKGGALVIGSLYWDPKRGREEWWNKSLDKGDGILVSLPTRYGRYSADPRNCYTMVFSSSLHKDQLGTGYILPHRTPTINSDSLRKQAMEMGEAEGLSAALIKDWGSVAMLLNPRSQYRDEIAECWMEFFGQRLENHSLLKPFDGDHSPINRNGFLSISWPTTLTDTNLVNYDYLLATTTRPKHKEDHNGVHRYPTIEEITAEVKKQLGSSYFEMNRKHGIKTFQDDEILEHLKQ